MTITADSNNISVASTESSSTTLSSSPLTSPRIVKRVVVRRVVSGITTAATPGKEQQQKENNIEISVQLPLSSSDENITESSPSNNVFDSQRSLTTMTPSPRREENESLSGQSPTTATNYQNGTFKENDSSMSPPLLARRQHQFTNNSDLQPPNVTTLQANKKTTDHRRSTSNLSSPSPSGSNRHSSTGGGVFGFLQRIASPLLSPNTPEHKQYSSSFSEGSTNSLLAAADDNNEDMRARSGGKAIASVQLADEKVVNNFLKDCESLREKRKFAELEKLCRDFLQRYYSTKSNMAKANIFLALALREGLLFKDSLCHFEEAFALDQQQQQQQQTNVNKSENGDDINEEEPSSTTTNTTTVHTNPFIIADYAHTLFCDKQYELAREYFEKALSISTRENLNNVEELKSAIILCQIMSTKIDPQQKAELVDELVKQSNNNQQAFTYYAIGLYYEKLQDYNKAIEYYTMSLKREPSYDCNYERIGTCQSKIGLLERAKCNLDMACTLNKQNFRAILALANLHLRAGMTGSCKTKLKIIIERSVQIVNSSSDKQRLYMILAESFYLLGVIKSSCEFGDNAEKLKSLFTTAIHYYSLHHELVKDDPEELSNYSIESYYNTIGLCNLYMKEYDSAMELFNQAEQVAEPNSCDGIYNKGVVMEQLGSLKEALQYYQKALQVKPNDQDSTDAIKRVNRKYRNSLFTHYGMIGLDICKP